MMFFIFSSLEGDWLETGMVCWLIFFQNVKATNLVNLYYFRVKLLNIGLGKHDVSQSMIEGVPGPMLPFSQIKEIWTDRGLCGIWLTGRLHFYFLLLRTPLVN